VDKRSAEGINSNGGFSFVKKLLDGNSRMPLWDVLFPAARNSRHSTSATVRSLVGIQTADGCDYADVTKFRGDLLFGHLVGEAVPDEATFRQRLDRLARNGDKWRDAVDSCVAAQIAAARLTPIEPGGILRGAEETREKICGK